MSQLSELQKFVKARQSSSSLEEIATKLGRTKSSVTVSARSLRKKGVNLKQLTSPIKGITEEDVIALNKLIDGDNK